MRVASFSIARAGEMDDLYGQPVGEFCERVRLRTVEQEPSATALLAMAHALGVDFDELCAYVLLRTYVNELRISAVTAPDSKRMASLLGVPRIDLELYLRKHAIMRSFVEDRKPTFHFRRGHACVGFPWEAEEALEPALLAEAAHMSLGD